MAAPGPQILELVHRSIALTLHDVKWVPGTARFVALGCLPRGTGVLQLYELDGSSLELVAQEEQPAGLKCASFGGGGGLGAAVPDAGQPLALGSFDGQLQLVDAERVGSGGGHVFRVQAHAGVVNALDACGSKNGGPPLIATCGQDGGVRVWDPRLPDAPAAAFLPAPGTPASDCWCVAIGNAHGEDECCVLAGYQNGDLKMFDLRACAVRWETNLGKGVCGVQFDRPAIPMNKFVAACLESRLALFDARTQHPAEGFAGLVEQVARDATLWAPRHLPQNREAFMLACGDGTLALHTYRYPDRRVVEDEETGEKRGVVGTSQLVCERAISSQPVAAFDWSPDKAGLFVAAAFDQTLRVGAVTQIDSL